MRTILVGSLVLLFVLAARAEDESDPLTEGRALLHTKKHDEGVAMLRELTRKLEAVTDDATKLLTLGRAHFYLEEDAQAVAALQKATRLEPENAELHYWLGVVWSYSDVDKAIQAHATALRHDPKHGSAWFEMGELRSRKKEHAEALEAYLKAAELKPDQARFHYKAGNALKSAKRHAEAVRCYERAVELSPGFTNAWYNAALTHYLDGRFEKARDAWAKAAELAPDDLMIHAKLVQACYALERLEEAETWRQKVLAIHEAWDDEQKEKQRDFCFDQFDVDDFHVYACERFDKEGGLYYHFVFKVVKAGKTLKQINLESSEVGRELGFPYVLGANEGDVHTTYDQRWDALPPYAELKEKVIEAIRGELPIGAQSEKGKIRVHRPR